jgi:hypothetical protein
LSLVGLPAAEPTAPYGDVVASGAMIVMSTPRRLDTRNLSVPLRSNNRDCSAEPPRDAPADQASTTTVSRRYRGSVAGARPRAGTSSFSSAIQSPRRQAVYL